jgi:integrase
VTPRISRAVPRRRPFMAQPFKHPDSGRFYIRRKVPKALQPVLGREYKRSLGTADPNEAKRKFALALVECDDVFDRAKANLQRAAHLTNSDVEVLAARWMKRELAEVEASGEFMKWIAIGSPRFVDRGDTYDEYEPLLTYEEAVDGDDAAAEALVLPHIKAALRAASFPMPGQNAPEYRRLVQAFTAHLFKLSELAFARLNGDWEQKAETIAARPLSGESEKRSGGRHLLLRAFEDYAEDRLATEGKTRAVLRTISAYRGFMRELVELCSNLAVQDITPAVVRDYRALIAKIPTKGQGIRKLNAREKIAKAETEGLSGASAGTISNKLRALSAVLSRAKELGRIKSNPVIEGRFLRDASKALRKQAIKRRKHYDANELAVIFGSVAFTSGWEPPRARFGQAWYWIPLLLYYTGARLEEIAQLAATDVRNAGDVVYLNILNADDEDDNGRGVKTDGSRRDVPLHPDLIALGFVEYVESVPQDGQLFPLLKKSGYSGAS